jgi:lysyl-tRNA synthetase class 2
MLQETRCRQRYLDMLVNEKSRKVILMRSKVIILSKFFFKSLHPTYPPFSTQITRHIRNYLENRGYVEVETPILTSLAGGANARPFETTMKALDLRMQLRIAPELFLKVF